MALGTSALRAMQHSPTLARARLGEPQTWLDVAALRAHSVLSLGSGWAAVPHFDPVQPAQGPRQRAKTRAFAGTSRVERTGIEPGTSCLQGDTADPLKGLIFQGLCWIATLAERRGYGGIRRD